MSEQEKTYQEAVAIFIQGIKNKTPFDELVEHELVQAAISYGFGIETIKEAWM